MICQLGQRQWGEYSVTGCEADPWRLARAMFNPFAMFQDVSLGFVFGAVFARLTPWLIGIGTTVAKGTAVEMVSLYRAVSTAEYKQLMTSGIFQPGKNSLGGKFFAESAEHAAQWGTKLNGAGNFKIIEVQLPKSAADKFMRWDKLDGIGPARYGDLGPLNAAKPIIKPVQ